MGIKDAAADRVIATLAKDPELLKAVQAKLGSTVSKGDGPLDEAITLLAEGTVAFQEFCIKNNIRRGVFNAGGQDRHPPVKVWKKFMRDNAIPRNVKIGRLLAAHFKGHLPPKVKEFMDYVDDYQDLITDWDSEVPNTPHTIGRNFPQGFGDYLKGVRDASETITAWAVLMVEHEFGQRDEGWTLWLGQGQALSYQKKKNSEPKNNPAQYFTYENPVPLEIDREVLTQIYQKGCVVSKSNYLPPKGTVVTMELIR